MVLFGLATQFLNIILYICHREDEKDAGQPSITEATEEEKQDPFLSMFSSQDPRESNGNNDGCLYSYLYWGYRNAHRLEGPVPRTFPVRWFPIKVVGFARRIRALILATIQWVALIPIILYARYASQKSTPGYLSLVDISPLELGLPFFMSWWLLITYGFTVWGTPNTAIILKYIKNLDEFVVVNVPRPEPNKKDKTKDKKKEEFVFSFEVVTKKKMGPTIRFRDKGTLNDVRTRIAKNTPGEDTEIFKTADGQKTQLIIRASVEEKEISNTKYVKTFITFQRNDDFFEDKKDNDSVAKDIVLKLQDGSCYDDDDSKDSELIIPLTKKNQKIQTQKYLSIQSFAEQAINTQVTMIVYISIQQRITIRSLLVTILRGQKSSTHLTWLAFLEALAWSISPHVVRVIQGKPAFGKYGSQSTTIVAASCLAVLSCFVIMFAISNYLTTHHLAIAQKLKNLQNAEILLLPKKSYAKYGWYMDMTMKENCQIWNDVFTILTKFDAAPMAEKSTMTQSMLILLAFLIGTVYLDAFFPTTVLEATYVLIDWRPGKEYEYLQAVTFVMVFFMLIIPTALAIWNSILVNNLMNRIKEREKSGIKIFGQRNYKITIWGKKITLNMVLYLFASWFSAELLNRVKHWGSDTGTNIINGTNITNVTNY